MYFHVRLALDLGGEHVDRLREVRLLLLQQLVPALVHRQLVPQDAQLALQLGQFPLCLPGRHPVLVRLLLLRGHGGLEAALLVLELRPDDAHLVPRHLQLRAHGHQLPGRALRVTTHVSKLGGLKTERWFISPIYT